MNLRGSSIERLLVNFKNAFTQPSLKNFVELAEGWILCQGRHSISRVIQFIPKGWGSNQVSRKHNRHSAPSSSCWAMSSMTLSVRKDLVVPEAKHSVALRFEPSSSCFVVGSLLLMLRAVDLDDQSLLEADEVYDVWAKWLLATELVTEDLPASQTNPQHSLRIGWLRTEFLSSMSDDSHCALDVPPARAACASRCQLDLPRVGGR